MNALGGPATSTRTRRVFISYAHSDAKIGESLAGELRARGLDVFSPQSLEPGDHWLSAVSEAIAASDACVVLVSSSSARAAGLLEEASLAVGRALSSPNTKILPIMLDRTSVPFPLSQFQAIHAERGGRDPARLGSVVADALDRGPHSPWTVGAIEQSIAIESVALQYEIIAANAQAAVRAGMVRRWLAASLIALFVALIGAVIWGLASGGAGLVGVIVSPLVALIGSLFGFLFGRARDR